MPCTRARCFYFCILGAGVICCSACSFFGSAATLEQLSSAALPRHSLVSGVPVLAQSENQCGPAALAMLLQWGGDPVDPSELSPSMYAAIPQGTFTFDFVGAARRRGALVIPYQASPESLTAEIASGNPVVALINKGLSWVPAWHYVVVSGYDLDGDSVVFHAGEATAERLPFAIFWQLWSRSDFWMAVVLPPRRLSATASRQQHYDALLALERIELWEAAGRGYSAALQRWKDDRDLLFSRAHVLYRRGLLSEAESDLRLLLSKEPEYAPALNNLAQILAERGKKEEALKLAGSALSLGGEYRESYERTLREIQSASKP